MNGVQLPMPAGRRRRGWMLWLLWGMLGTALTMEGLTPEDGAPLALALWLSAPFWALFAAWPLMWIVDRIRARGLWAQEALTVPALDGEGFADVVLGRDDLWVPGECLGESGRSLPRAADLPGMPASGVLLSALMRWRAEQSASSLKDEALRSWVLVLIEAEAAARRG